MSKKNEPLPPMQNEPNQAEVDRKCADMLLAGKQKQDEKKGGK